MSKYSRMLGCGHSYIYDFRAVCTRACRFCAVKTGLPNELDLNEPERVAESVELMNLKHVVLLLLHVMI